MIVNPKENNNPKLTEAYALQENADVKNLYKVAEEFQQKIGAISADEWKSFFPETDALNSPIIRTPEVTGDIDELVSYLENLDIEKYKNLFNKLKEDIAGKEKAHNLLLVQDVDPNKTLPRLFTSDEVSLEDHEILTISKEIELLIQELKEDIENRYKTGWKTIKVGDIKDRLLKGPLKKITEPTFVGRFSSMSGVPGVSYGSPFALNHIAESIEVLENIKKMVLVADAA